MLIKYTVYCKRVRRYV